MPEPMYPEHYQIGAAMRTIVLAKRLVDGCTATYGGGYEAKPFDAPALAMHLCLLLGTDAERYEEEEDRIMANVRKISAHIPRDYWEEAMRKVPNA